ncbi:MAG: YceI family protein [Candidatus Acidiferrales bacterium]|jgi:polyisoprenoid-binding protein YceI
MADIVGVTCSAGVSPALGFRLHSEPAGGEAKNLSSPGATRNHVCPTILFLAAACVFALAPSLCAQEISVTLDPAATKIGFTLSATLHMVHGTFKLKSGQIHLDPATGKVSGSVIVDAASANTDNSSRDRKMHAEVLESAKFPEITFTPSHVKGSIAQQGTSQLEVAGVLRLRGQDHSLTLAIAIDRSANGQFHASTKFPVPYVKWGLTNPSNFLLHVSDTVNLDVDAVGQIVSTAAGH